MKKWIAIILALAMLLSAFALGEATETEDYYDDSDDFDFSEELDSSEWITVEDYAITENLPDEWQNILLLGTDNRYETQSHGRTDSIIILSVNLSTNEAKLTSIMRDTYVHIDGHGTCKINAASVYGGPEMTMKVVNENFGMNIEKYVLINITGLANVIDMLGGLDMDVTEAERKALNKGLFDLSDYSDMTKLEESGENVHLNGNQAVAYARIRKIDTDYRRTERQRYVLTKIAQKLQDNDVSTILNAITSLLPYVETNLSFTELMSLASVGLGMDFSNVPQLRLPAEGTSTDGMYNGVWCIRANFEKNKEILHAFVYGEDE